MTAVAGFVDAVGYLTLRHIFAANMSGNSIGMGMNFAQGQWMRAWERGWPILMFIVGLVIGSVLFELAKRQKLKRMLFAAMLLEAILLGALLALGAIWFGLSPSPEASEGAHFLILAAAAAVAMGMQNASLRKVGALTIYTTFVTGTVTKFAEGAVAYAFWAGERIGANRPCRLRRIIAVSSRQPAVRESVVLALVWIGYVAGACAGEISRQVWGMACLAWPLGVVMVIGVIDYFSPSSI